jgi:hypothetical protein
MTSQEICICRKEIVGHSGHSNFHSFIDFKISLLYLFLILSTFFSRIRREDTYVHYVQKMNPTNHMEHSCIDHDLPQNPMSIIIINSVYTGSKPQPDNDYRDRARNLFAWGGFCMNPIHRKCGVPKPRQDSTELPIPIPMGRYASGQGGKSLSHTCGTRVSVVGYPMGTTHLICPECKQAIVLGLPRCVHCGTACGSVSDMEIHSRDCTARVGDR